MIERYRDHGQWYSETRRQIERRFGDDADLFCDLLAATSPRKQVKANWNLALRIYSAHKSGRAYPTVGVLPCHRANVERALKREPLSGNKVRAFADNLKGNRHKVTIDIWICRYYGVETLTDKVYQELSDRICSEAAIAGMKPAEYQAMIWTIARVKAGKKPSSFAGIAAQGLLFGDCV